MLPATSARHEVGTSRRAVVTRERRWLVAEWNGPYGAHSESLQEACGSGHRCSPRPPPGKPSTIPCEYPGASTVRGAIWDRLGGAWRLTEDALLKSESLRFNRSHNEPDRSRSGSTPLFLKLIHHVEFTRSPVHILPFSSLTKIAITPPKNKVTKINFS